MKQVTDIISVQEAGTLAGLFRERVKRSAERVAYRHCDKDNGQWHDTTWSEMAQMVARWQLAMQAEGLQPGDRVAIMLRNCREWVMFDQAALGLGLVTVPLYVEDRAENAAYCMEDSGAKLLLLEGELQWRHFHDAGLHLEGIERIVSLHPIHNVDDSRLRTVEEWLPKESRELIVADSEADGLVSIVYTSGTTGRPKGVMLSHTNMLTNAYAGLQKVSIYPGDVAISFLPLSHTLERTAGYYLLMMAGATVAYARSIPQLAEDLQAVRPTVIVTVPRIFERVYNRIKEQLEDRPKVARVLFEMAVKVGWQRFEHLQKRVSWSPTLLLWPLLDKLVAGKIRERLGGRMRVAVSGGAPLSPDIAQVFLGLGVPVVQGYGLTEASPVISVNTLEDNIPASIGKAFENLEVRLSDEGELLARGPSIMMGYWNNPEATAEAVDPDSWLHTGDKARLDEQGHIFITGRLKEIIVLANGEKIPPADMEMAIAMDVLFEQVMVIGEGRPYLSALVVLNSDQWRVLRELHELPNEDDELLRHRKVETFVLERISQQLAAFPGYARIRRVAVSLSPWTIEQGLLTPTLKLRRNRILEYYGEEVERLYAGH